jgi:hypothetical protein
MFLKISRWLFLFIAMLVIQQAAGVSAHMAVEDRFYEDVEFSKAKELIVLLRGLNVISADHYVSLYMPQEKLTRADLAFWIANFRKLAESGAKPEQWRQAAREQGLVSSLDGNATYRDADQAYFDGKAPLPDRPDGELTREQFAVYMGQFLIQAINGKTLYESAGLTAGPRGVIDKVTKRTDASLNEDSPQFDVVVTGKPYPLSMHPIMLHGSVDLGVWPGMAIGASWLAMEDDGSLSVKIINVDDSRPPVTSMGITPDKAATGGSFPMLPIIGILFLAVLGIQFYLRKRRKVE